MAKKGFDGFTDASMKKNGYVSDGKGGYKPAPKTSAVDSVPLKGMPPPATLYSLIKEHQKKVKRGRPSKDESPVKDSFKVIRKILTDEIVGYEITLAGLAMSLNHGLLQKHWSVIAKSKEEYQLRILALNIPKIKGQVNITYIRHSVGTLDSSDNLMSSLKIPLDALVRNQIIENDSADIIPNTITAKQVKCRRKDARMEFIIERL